MFEILDAVLERAQARGAADVEVFGERSTSHRIKVYRQEVEQLTAAQRRGVGVRVFSAGAVGHAYTSDLSDGALEHGVQDLEHQPVPPTVISAMRSVACPVPTGTPCPSLPQMPVLTSKSPAITSIFMRMSMPLPTRVAPRSGVVILPSSIR